MAFRPPPRRWSAPKFGGVPFGESCVEVQHERIGIAAQFGNDEWQALGIRPEMKATSRDSRSSLETKTLHLAFGRQQCGCEGGRRSSASALAIASQRCAALANEELA